MNAPEPDASPQGGAANPSGAEPGSPRELRRAQRLETRRREIVAVAEELFAAHGYEGTSLEKIASGTGYSVGGIYNFFPSKDAVYAAVLERNTLLLAEHLQECLALAGSGIDKLTAMASIAIRRLRMFPDRPHLTLGTLAPDRRGPGEKGRTKAVLEVYAAAIREGQLDGTVRAGDAGMLAHYAGGLIFAHMGVDLVISGHSEGIPLDDFLDIVRQALSRPTHGPRPGAATPPSAAG